MFPPDVEEGLELLRLSGFGVAFGARVILKNIHWVVPERGVTVLLGPGGAGKSTLLRTLAGLNDPQPAMKVSGTAMFGALPLGEGPRPVLVMQKMRLLLESVFENLVCDVPMRPAMNRAQLDEVARRLLARGGLRELSDQLDKDVLSLSLGKQRRVAILRTTTTNPELLCLDETTADLDDTEANAVLDLVREEGRRRAVLFVTHQQQHARRVADQAALLVDGQLIEAGTAEEFFNAPRTDTARQFLRTGSCYLANEQSLVDLPEVVEASGPPVAAGPAQGHIKVGFRWLKRGLLGGMPRPGLLNDLDAELAELQRLRVGVVVSLEEEGLSPERLRRHGLQAIHVPVRDMDAPSLQQANELCQTIARLNQEGTPVVVHCRAGLGRTGTQMACQLIYEGADARQALEQVRRIEPFWVQSEEQVRFLQAFAQEVRHSG